MSTVRSPKKAVAKCTFPGCKFVRIFFDWHQPKSQYTAHFTPELRAEMSLFAHVRKKHPSGSVQNAQHLRPVQR